jgi:predicted type IV restriction endonuclease
MTTQEQAYDRIKQKVQEFKNLPVARQKAMNENATRQGFILPLFNALGWNVEDINEVSPEERVSKGWVDFAFRLSGIPRFFLETKKASEDLDDRRHALARRIEEVDRAIDQTVYQVYGLTEEEVRLVEGK